MIPLGSFGSVHMMYIELALTACTCGAERLAGTAPNEKMTSQMSNTPE